MSDHEVRALERRVAAGEEDQRPALERAWLRSGRGWHGELLPEGVRPSEDRGVYVAHRRLVTVRDEVRGPVSWSELDLELVYVPAGEVVCHECRWSGRIREDLASVGCRACDGVGALGVAALYLGRYPVTCLEWGVYGDWRAPGTRRPMTEVTFADTLTFCSWAGLRLPTTSEWRWAALGGLVECKEDCRSLERSGHQDAHCPCHSCGGTGRIPRRYPWGDAEPTRQRCVSAPSLRFRRAVSSETAAGPILAGSLVTLDPTGGWRAAAPGDVPMGVVRAVRPDGRIEVEFGAPGPYGRIEVEFGAPGPYDAQAMFTAAGHTEPVVRCAACVRGDCYVASGCADRPDVPSAWKERLAPARPAGASWCGAQDMAGNVFEWTSDEDALGGSYATEPMAERGRTGHVDRLTEPSMVHRPGPDLGFRVALSAV